jgi:5-(carboxyamino)imidazole ribonucleotide mutase
VIGIPIESKALHGMDSLLSIAQMPPGVPVATMAIGGAVNAGLFAARILALRDEHVASRLTAYVRKMHDDAARSTPSA